jgi:hypothetical protein
MNAIPHPATATRGRHGTRMHGWRFWAMFVALFSTALAIPAVIGVLVGTPHTASTCQRPRPCGTPPTSPVSATPLTVFRSPALGFQLGFAADEW